MFWRFEELPGAGGNASLLYDDVRHLLRNGERDWVRLPYHSALILSLLLRMQEHGYTLSARQICAFLGLPAGTRVSNDVTKLRRTIGECGVDAARVLEPNETKNGYRLAAGVRAARLSEAEVRAWFDELLARAEKVGEGEGVQQRAPRAPRVQLREMLVLCSVFALGVTGYLRLRPGDERPIVRHDPEEGVLAGTRIPYRACVELARELGLRDQDVLAVELSRLSPSAAARVVISVERERRQEGSSAATFDLAPGATPTSTVRIPAASLEPGVRAHARRICLGELGYVESALRPGAIRLQEVRVE
jgi:hypothetical protein